MQEINKLWYEYLADSDWWSLTDPDEDASFADFMQWFDKQSEEKQ